MKKLEALLCDEIADEFSDLSEMEVGTEAYKTTVDGIVKLADRVLEIKKHEDEVRKDADIRREEIRFKQQEAKREQVDRVIRNCISVASIVVPCAITIWGTIITLKFEEEGTVTTIMGRGFINKLLPKK